MLDLCVVRNRFNKYCIKKGGGRRLFIYCSPVLSQRPLLHSPLPPAVLFARPLSLRQHPPQQLEAPLHPQPGCWMPCGAVAGSRRCPLLLHCPHAPPAAPQNAAQTWTCQPCARGRRPPLLFHWPSLGVCSARLPGRAGLRSEPGVKWGYSHHRCTRDQAQNCDPGTAHPTPPPQIHHV